MRVINVCVCVCVANLNFTHSEIYIKGQCRSVRAHIRTLFMLRMANAGQSNMWQLLCTVHAHVHTISWYDYAVLVLPMCVASKSDAREPSSGARRRAVRWCYLRTIYRWTLCSAHFHHIRCWCGGWCFDQAIIYENVTKKMFMSLMAI